MTQDIGTRLGCNEKRTTSYINRRPASVLLHSDRVAARIGRLPNIEVQISFWKTKLPSEAISKTFERSIRGRKFSYWSRPKQAGQRKDFNGPPTYAWVIEKGDTYPHVHWCVHIRPQCLPSFKRQLKKWIDAVPELAEVPFDELVSIRPLPNYSGYKMYICKGMDPAYGNAWNVRNSSQGRVVGKRSGVSKNLSRAARLASNRA